MPDLPPQLPEIVITAALSPVDQDSSAASVSQIDEARIERLGDPFVASLLRLIPSASVSASHAGSLTQVRIRGAEADHSLLFVDGIKLNDPAAGNQPRFELLNADLASRIEVVRGPQSALWGAEAIGGVIAVNGVGLPGKQGMMTAEAGSLGFRRAAAGLRTETGPVRVSAALGLQRADGIDSFDGRGDRDGYRNLSGRLSLAVDAGGSLTLGANGLALSGTSQFDGYDPVSFLRADTADSTRNRLVAGRVWASHSAAAADRSATLSLSALRSSNRNRLAGDPINRTIGTRSAASLQVRQGLAFGGVDQQFTLLADHERETFQADDIAFGGATSQDRNRARQALALEWRGEAGPLVADVAIRHDRFNRFDDATSLRASLLGRLGGGWSVSGAYGEGIAQPSFFDLYGFFPGMFVGNPSLRPERSRGVEASLRYRGPDLSGAVTVYRQRLNDEIVDIFDPVTFVAGTANRRSKSHRQGVEVEAGWSPDERLRLSAHYAFLDATQPGAVDGADEREVRRPRHSGAIAIDGRWDRLSYGMSLAFTGARADNDFDTFPARIVRLSPYWLGGARLAYALTPRLDIFARAANAFDADYQDVVANRTEGRTIHVGFRLADRR